MPKILSNDQQGQLERDGHTDAVDILTGEEVGRYRASLERFERNHPEHVAKLESKSEILAPWIVEIAETPRLLDLFEDLFGPNLMIRNMAWRMKKPDGRTFAGWHQDTAAYGANEMTPKYYLGALALSDCGPDDGCIQVIPGSHKGPTLPHQDRDDTASILARGQEITVSFDKSRIAPLALKPGQFALFDPAIIHSSGVNSGQDRRIILLISMIPTFARSITAKPSAMLVRGIDEFHNFAQEPRPEAEGSPEAIAAGERLIRSKAKAVYAKSSVAPKAGYGGARSLLVD